MDSLSFLHTAHRRMLQGLRLNRLAHTPRILRFVALYGTLMAGSVAGAAPLSHEDLTDQLNTLLRPGARHCQRLIGLC